MFKNTSFVLKIDFVKYRLYSKRKMQEFMKFYWNIKIYVQYIFDGDIVMQNWLQVISSEIDSIEFGKKLKLFIYPYNLSTK